MDTKQLNAYTRSLLIDLQNKDFMPCDIMYIGMMLQSMASNMATIEVVNNIHKYR